MIGVCFWYTAGRTFTNVVAAAMVSLRKWWGGRFSFFTIGPGFHILFSFWEDFLFLSWGKWVEFCEFGRVWDY